jgi:hypothetical protein
MPGRHRANHPYTSGTVCVHPPVLDLCTPAQHRGSMRSIGISRPRLPRHPAEDGLPPPPIPATSPALLLITFNPHPARSNPVSSPLSQIPPDPAASIAASSARPPPPAKWLPTLLHCLNCRLKHDRVVGEAATGSAGEQPDQGIAERNSSRTMIRAWSSRRVLVPGLGADRREAARFPPQDLVLVLVLTTSDR